MGKNQYHSLNGSELESSVEDLSSRKLPSNGRDLVLNFQDDFMYKAAEFFKPYSEYEIVNPDGMKREDLEKIPIRGDVLDSMFNSVITNSGEYAYSGETSLVEVESPANIPKIQTFIFREHLEGMGDDINERYDGPTLILDHGDKEMAIYMPPILEYHRGRGYVLIDGLHRFYKAYTQNKKIRAITISARVDLPADVIGVVSDLCEDDILDEYVRTGDFDSLGRPKYQGLKPEFFRMYNRSGFGKFDKTKPKI